MNIADRLLSPNWRFHPSAQPNIISLYGRDEFKAWAGDLSAPFPTSGRRSTIRSPKGPGRSSLDVAGTQTGEYMGAPRRGTTSR